MNNMLCGCNNKLNMDNNKLDTNKILSLDSMASMPIDEIVDMYRQGYVLENTENHYSNVTSLSPDIAIHSALSTWTSGGGVGTSFLIENSGTTGVARFIGYRKYSIAGPYTEYANTVRCIGSTINTHINPLYELIYLQGASTSPQYAKIEAYNCTQGGVCPSSCGTYSFSAVLDPIEIYNAPQVTPGPVTGLTLTVGDRSLYATWTDPLYTPIYAYLVRLKQGNTQLVAGYVTSSGFTISYLTNDLPYTLEVNVVTDDYYLSTMASTTATPVAPPTITVTSPNGGENWLQSSLHNITWTSINVAGNVKIELFKGGILNTTISPGVVASTGTYSWNIPSGQTVGTDYTIKITSVDNTSVTDSSDTNFGISSPIVPTITVTSPNGNENWSKNSMYYITWTSSNVTGNIKIELFKGGILNTVISPGTTDTGTYSWTIPSGQTVGTDYTIKITSVDNTSVTDSSDTNFQISAPSISTITVTSPNGGENWLQSSLHNITWTSTNVTGNVKIELFKGGILNTTISSGVVASTGTYSWTIPSGQTVGTDYTIKITSVDNTSVTDNSDTNFQISTSSTSTITVTSPNGGENWLRGSAHSITWTLTNVTGNVKIELFKGGILNTTISSGVIASIGTYSWTIPSGQTIGTDYTIKITSINNTSITDSSNTTFGISAVAPILTSISPSSVTLLLDTTQQFTAKDQNGNTISTGVTWEKTGVGTISTTGLYSAGSIIGTATISATYLGVTKNASVTVSETPATEGGAGILFGIIGVAVLGIMMSSKKP